jgi:hypothetical protein
VLKRVTLAAILALLAACNGSSSPTDPQESQPHGRLSGTVTIGPNCPGPATGSQGCPTPPDAYAARKILVYNAAKSTLLHTVDIDSQGLYTILLVPATYVLDLKTSSAADHTAELPVNVTIQANATAVVNVNIDTGIR